MLDFLKPLVTLAKRLKGFSLFAAFIILALLVLFVWSFSMGSFDPLVANFASLGKDQFFWIVITIFGLSFGAFVLLVVLAYRRTMPLEKTGAAIVYVVVHEQGDETVGIGGAEVVIALPEPVKKMTAENGATNFTANVIGQKIKINAKKAGYAETQPLEIEIRDGATLFIPLTRLQTPRQPAADRADARAKHELPQDDRGPARRASERAETVAANDETVRQILRARQAFRVPMTELAAMYYRRQLADSYERIMPDDIAVLSKKCFLPDEPLDAHDVDRTLIWDDGGPPTPADLSLPTMASILKNQSSNSKMYDGVLYRILDGDGASFRFCRGSYFAFLNTCECLSYELAQAAAGNRVLYNLIEKGGWQNLQKAADFLLGNQDLIPIRARSDPFDFRLRSSAFGTCALVVVKRSRKTPLFILNVRSQELSETPGLRHVIPAGTFQPNMQDDRFHAVEFSFVENIIREFIEELIEDYHMRGDALSVFNIIDMYGDKGRAFRKTVIDPGNFELQYLGLVIDPINLKPEVIMVLMMHDAYLQHISKLGLESSWETQSSTIGFHEFTQKQLTALMQDASLVPTGKAHLWLTLQHYDYLAAKLARL